MSKSINSSPPTIPLYLKDGTLLTHSTTITGIQRYDTVPESIQQLFKPPPTDPTTTYVVTTQSTIFHPQGGGQPSDIGTMNISTKSMTVTVETVRQAPLDPETGQLYIYHLCTIATAVDQQLPDVGDEVTQTLDQATRQLHSRLHTAGHLLGLAARHYLESAESGSDIQPGQLVDGKASHFPGMANVEFSGSPLVASTHRSGIQGRLDRYLTEDLDVHVHEWDADQLDDPTNRVYWDPGQFRLMPIQQEDAGAGKMGLRCVSIGDKGAYPCGGTHVRNTRELGRVEAYKISRVAGKGISRISYRLLD